MTFSMDLYAPGNLVEHALVFAALDAGRLVRQVLDGEALLRLPARHLPAGTVRRAGQALVVAEAA
jgi:hypothetical protein